MPWPAAGTPRRRRGWLLLLRGRNARGWGECAPLPAAGTETASAAARRLHLLQGRPLDHRLLRRHLPRLAARAPAVACALETALLDLEARARGLPLRSLLHAGAPASLAVNAVAAPPWSRSVPRALEEGFRVVKLKVGLLPWEEEMEALEALCHTLPPGARLRLDVNRAWPEETARRFLARLEGLPVESVEEPLQRPSAGALHRLQQDSPVDLTLDESFRPLGGTVLLDRFPVRRLVLKPMVQGGPGQTLALAERALERGILPVITSTLESAVGLHAAAHLAAAVEALRPGIAHGLATAGWLAHHPVPPPRIRKGRLLLDNAPGLGVEP